VQGGDNLGERTRRGIELENQRDVLLARYQIRGPSAAIASQRFAVVSDC
jgi:hypothetical protein